MKRVLGAPVIIASTILYETQCTMPLCCGWLATIRETSATALSSRLYHSASGSGLPYLSFFRRPSQTQRMWMGEFSGGESRGYSDIVDIRIVQSHDYAEDFGNKKGGGHQQKLGTVGSEVAGGEIGGEPEGREGIPGTEAVGVGVQEPGGVYQPCERVEF